MLKTIIVVLFRLGVDSMLSLNCRPRQIVRRAIENSCKTQMITENKNNCKDEILKLKKVM